MNKSLNPVKIIFKGLVFFSLSLFLIANNVKKVTKHFLWSCVLNFRLAFYIRLDNVKKVKSFTLWGLLKCRSSQWHAKWLKKDPEHFFLRQLSNGMNEFCDCTCIIHMYCMALGQPNLLAEQHFYNTGPFQYTVSGK